MSRYLAVALLAALVALAATVPAAAQAEDAADALRNSPVYAAPGAEEVDLGALRATVEEARDAGIDLRVAVLASGNAEAIAVEIGSELRGATIVVFTRDSFGVASDEVAQGRLSDAMAAAADELSGPDAAAGLAALVDALEPGGGVPVGLIALGAILMLLAVGIGGRLWDVRTRERRQAKRRHRRQAELSARVGELGGRIVDLSDRVELAESDAARARYAEAVELFDSADRRIAAATTMHDLDDVDADLDRAEGLLIQVDVEVKG